MATKADTIRKSVNTNVPASKIAAARKLDINVKGTSSTDNTNVTIIAHVNIMVSKKTSDNILANRVVIASRNKVATTNGRADINILVNKVAMMRKKVNANILVTKAAIAKKKADTNIPTSKFATTKRRVDTIVTAIVHSKCIHQ